MSLSACVTCAAKRSPLALVLLFAAICAVACGGGDAPVDTATIDVSSTTTAFAPTPTTPSPAPATPAPTTTAEAPRSEPAGFPIDPATRTDRVVGAPGSRVLQALAGPPVGEYSARDQVGDDPLRANASGWDCRVHVEYEGTPAVDWYVQPGTPVRATMDGTAVLVVNTYANAFDFYNVPREPYIGDPDRARAPLDPFPGPGGGMGVYVSVLNNDYRTDSGHLDIDRTVAGVPGPAFSAGFSRATDYRARYGQPRAPDAGDVVASWQVRRGDVIGYTGDAGYSEAPHLHYQITRRRDGAKLCPTDEAGFADGGWLTR